MDKIPYAVGLQELADWTPELPQREGYYLWWCPDVIGSAGSRNGPCAGLVRITKVEQGFGWPTFDGRYLGMVGSSLPQLFSVDKTLWASMQ